MTKYMMSLWVFFLSTQAFAATDGVTVLYDVSVSPRVASEEVVQMEGKYYIKKDHVRFETDVPGNPMGKTIVIATSKPKRAFLLFPSRKAYMNVSSEELAKASSKKREAMSSGKPFKATGKSRNIAGYSCQVMVRDLADRHEEACTSATLKNVLKDLEEVYPRRAEDTAAIPKGLNGFPLEYQVRGKEGKVTHMTMRVKELRRTSLASSLFEVPKGYAQDKPFTMPSPEQMEEMQKHMKDMMKNMGAPAQ